MRNPGSVQANTFLIGADAAISHAAIYAEFSAYHKRAQDNDQQLAPALLRLRMEVFPSFLGAWTRLHNLVIIAATGAGMRGGSDRLLSLLRQAKGVDEVSALFSAMSTTNLAQLCNIKAFQWLDYPQGVNGFEIRESDVTSAARCTRHAAENYLITHRLTNLQNFMTKENYDVASCLLNSRSALGEKKYGPLLSELPPNISHIPNEVFLHLINAFLGNGKTKFSRRKIDRAQQ